MKKSVTEKKGKFGIVLSRYRTCALDLGYLGAQEGANLVVRSLRSRARNLSTYERGAP
jgi:hypothetical protein